MSAFPRTLLVLVGETAAGKSALALELAQAHDLELVSMDSMQVYRGMDVGTAKPTRAERERVPHHALDRVEPWERYDVRAWLADAHAALEAAHARGRRALFVGGTGFYLQSLLAGLFAGPPTDLEQRERLQARARAEGSAALHAELARVDPDAAVRIHPNDEKRVLRGLEVFASTGRTLSSWQRERGWSGAADALAPHRAVGLAHDKEALEARIGERTRAMLAAGWPEEVERIRDAGGFGPTAIQALGYREVLAHVEGRASLAETQTAIELKTRQFARRQRTWFRRFPELCWIRAESADPAAAAAAALGLATCF